MQRGSIRKRGSTWTAYYYVNAGGGRRQRSKGGFATKRQAQAYLNEVLATLQSGDFVAPSRLTLGEYLLERWLPTMEHRLRPSTWVSYRRVLERHVIPVLGGTPLQELTADQLDQLYAQLTARGHHKGHGLAPKTVRYVHTTMHKALRDAERKRLVSRNVASAADPPKLRHSAEREMRTWRAEELRRFLEGVREHRLYPAYLLAATTGMRRGEVLGLRWSDIDCGARRLVVRQTLLSINYELSFGAPKTHRGRRSITLDEVTIAALTEQRRRQRQERQLIGPAYNDLDLVFARPEGTPVHPDYFTQSFERAVARLGLARIRLHDLRHTHATLGLAAGVPAKVMADRLGHATVAFTQDVYMHAIPELENEAAEQVASVIFGSASA